MEPIFGATHREYKRLTGYCNRQIRAQYRLRHDEQHPSGWIVGHIGSLAGKYKINERRDTLAMARRIRESLGPVQLP